MKVKMECIYLHYFKQNMRKKEEKKSYEN